MKKEKEVRKAEFKKALIKKLKSLIAPLVLLALITAGILIVLFWKKEPEKEQIIKIHSYEEGAKQYVLENDKLKFEMDGETTQFTLTVKSTGKVWKSVPDNVDSDQKALTLEKERLKSTMHLTYSTVNGVDTLYQNYTYSMIRKSYEIEEGQDAVTIHYTVGELEKEFIIPTIISAAKLDALMEKMESSQRMQVKDSYKKYDINNLGAKDDKEQLLADYPILENEICYILRQGTKDNVRTKLEQYFAAAGYTTEDYAEDRANDLTQATTDKPVFNVNVTYRLEGSDLVVEVPLNEIEYREDFPALKICMLPYFGAGGTDDEGYMLVPEGGGAIIRFNNGKTAQNGYYANMYGWDMGTDRSAVVNDTDTAFNVFGVAQGNDSFLCILEEGTSRVSIQADISGKTNSYNYVNATFDILHREQYEVADRYNGKMFVYEKEIPEETIVSRYRFIDSGDYVKMANVYHDYLNERSGGNLSLRQDKSAPAVIEILCAADKIKQFLGVPVSKPLKLTTYKEAEEILKELSKEGVGNISVKLTGWANGGVQQKILKDVDPVKEAGNKKDLKALADYTQSAGMQLYLDGITNYAYDSKLTDGFLVSRDAARQVSNEKAELFQYSTVTYGKLKGDDTYYLLKADLIDTMADNLAKAAAKYQANVSLQDIGRDLSSDFREEDPVSRQEALNRHVEILKAIRNLGEKVMINRGNDYAVCYSDMITNMGLKGCAYAIIDEEVPFYQIALHGYVDYTGESVNLAQDYEEQVLRSAEYGAGLSFTVMKESAFVLQNTAYSKYFGTSYDGWHDKIVEIYTRFNQELGHTYNQRMVNHETVNEWITCTTYEDGTKVYVNYGYTDQTVDGKNFPARDYVVVR